jgi:hypothetical protein
MPQFGKQPDINTNSSPTSSGLRTTGAETEAVGSGSRSAHPSSPGLIWAMAIGAVLAGIAAIYYIRASARRAWQKYAAEIKGEYGPRNQISPRYVSGSLGDRALFMETATNNDDDAPYYHTRVSMPISNPGQLILGLRRKSMLEEAQTRNEKPKFESGDTDFDRRFHLVTNDNEPLGQILDQDMRKLLLQYNDIEVYVGVKVAEWRRAGEVSDIRAIRHLNSALARIASTVDGLSKRSLPLSQRLADEELIRKGI